jgi:hypothetical protein
MEKHRVTKRRIFSIGIVLIAMTVSCSFYFIGSANAYYDPYQGSYLGSYSNNLYSYNPNVGFTNPYYSPYYSNSSGTTPPTSKLPTEIFDLLSSSDWNTSQKGIELMKDWWGNSSNNPIPNNAYSYSSGNRIPSNTGIGSYTVFGPPPSYPATIDGMPIYFMRRY